MNTGNDFALISRANFGDDPYMLFGVLFIYLFIFFFLFFIYSRFKILKASLNKLIQSHDVQRDNYCTKVFVNYYNLGKKDLQIHNSTNKTRYETKR